MYSSQYCRERGHGRDHMIVRFTTTYNVHVQSMPITTGKVYSIQYYVIKFVSDLRQVSGFLHQ